jgi:hypothetical protein
MKPIRELLPTDIPTTEQALSYELSKANEKLFYLNKENTKLKRELDSANVELNFWRRQDKKRNKKNKRNKPKL